jgi:PPK2 family polyphosphate:nucleotide phosphotransferase
LCGERETGESATHDERSPKGGRFVVMGFAWCVRDGVARHGSTRQFRGSSHPEAVLSLPAKSQYLVPFDGSFRIAEAPTAPADDPGKSECRKRLEDATERIAELQPILHAHDHHAVLLIFQALDAAGKDGTIRAVLSGVNPAGCQVHSFKAPSVEELDHDFLWRTTLRLPARGMIGVFNRSYYEEVLIVRVHPELLVAQRVPHASRAASIWEERFESIRQHELHLTRNGVVLVKFFLHVSLEEQRARFLSRLDEPHKHWKFNPADVREREHRDGYMHAFEDALRETSRSWAPWYAIPADDKPYMRMCVGEIVAQTLEALDLHYPDVRAEDRARWREMRTLLE